MNWDEITTAASDNAGRIITIGGAVGVVIVWGKKAWSWVVKRATFQRYMRTMLDSMKDERDGFLMIYESDAKRWNKGLEDVAEVKGILKNGVSHKLALLAAQHRQTMELDPRPIFVCDENGNNLLSSWGYLCLIGLTDHDELSSAQWRSVLTGELKDSYLADFTLASDNKMTLKSVSDFQNPDTGEHRGRWRVIAPCVAVNEALVFTGRFIPVDDKAREIAAKFGWE
jgi:hypothetical protein